MKMTNMTPKEKAEELVQKFIYRTKDYVEIEDAKNCATILVDDILDMCSKSTIEYWQQVKEEIENL